MRKLCAIVLALASGCSNPEGTESGTDAVWSDKKSESFLELTDDQWVKISEEPDSEFALTALNSMGELAVFEELDTKWLREIATRAPDSVGGHKAIRLLLSQMGEQEAVAFTKECVNERLNSRVGVEAAAWLLRHSVGIEDRSMLASTLTVVARHLQPAYIEDDLLVTAVRSAFEAEGRPELASRVNEVQYTPSGILLLLQDFLALQQAQSSALDEAIANLFRSDFYCSKSLYSTSVQSISSFLNDIIADDSLVMEDPQLIRTLSQLLAGIAERVKAQSCLINSHAMESNSDLQYLVVVCAEAYGQLFVRGVQNGDEEFHEIVSIADRLDTVQLFGVSEILYNFACDIAPDTAEKEKIALKLVQLYAYNLDAKNYALTFLNENFRTIQSPDLIARLAELEYDSRNFSRVVDLLTAYRQEHSGTPEQMNKLDFIIGVSMIQLGAKAEGRLILERVKAVTNSEALKQNIENVLAI